MSAHKLLYETDVYSAMLQDSQELRIACPVASAAPACCRGQAAVRHTKVA